MRTRKWSYVEQEAKRLAALGLSPREIARRLEVNKSTVTRWIAAGKLEVRTRLTLTGTGQNPAQWAATVRKDYALDATDEQLVTLAESALALALDPSTAPHVRMTAAGRFQAIVRQLALVARVADVQTPGLRTAEPLTLVEVPTVRVDPRRLLMAVK